jgi:hypothetical protein
MITVKSLNSVLIDGEHVGNIVEACRNWPKLSPVELQSAMQVYQDSLDAQNSDITADRDRLAKLLAEASAHFDNGDIEALKKMRAAALQTEDEKKLAAARAKKAEAEAEIAALT